MDKFSGRGARGIFLKFLGKHWARLTGMSPIYLYRADEMGTRVKKDGITAYTLRNHNEFYDKGIKILLIDNLDRKSTQVESSFFKQVNVSSYDGRCFKPLQKFFADTSIIDRFQAKNFISAYVPDYGAIVFNTIEDTGLVDASGCFILGKDLKLRECSEFCVTVSVPGSASAPAEVKVRSDNGPSISHVGGVDFCWSGVPGTIFSICK
ncbi:MAG: hypothetical protein HUK40_22720 [Desulfobacter sp.]|nr:hypothetical protein [Desulfobacter sp.]